MDTKLSQKEAIATLMTRFGSDPENPLFWWKLNTLVAALHANSGILASEAGVSARLRDLRKDGWIVDKRIRKGANKLYEYSIRKP